MKEICKFDCKVRRHKQGQMLITIPKRHRFNFREDEPITVSIHKRKVYRYSELVETKREVERNASRKKQV